MKTKTEMPRGIVPAEISQKVLRSSLEVWGRDLRGGTSMGGLESFGDWIEGGSIKGQPEGG